MNNWALINADNKVLQNKLTYHEAEALQRHYTEPTKIILQETEEQRKTYIDNCRKSKELAKKVIKSLEEYGLNKKNSNSSFTIFTKRGTKDLASIQMFIDKITPCYLENQWSIVLTDDISHYITLDGTKIKYNY